MLSKIDLIQSLIDECSMKFRSLVESNEMKMFKNPCLTKEQILTCFQSGYSNNKRPFNAKINGKSINLSSLEIQCLFFLKFGSSAVQIAECLCKSQSTVKDRIESLKTKSKRKFFCTLRLR